MQVKRIILFLALALSLAACGVGGTDDAASPTPPATEAVAKATEEPTEAPVDEPTVEPTTETGGSSGDFDSEIPAPPASSAYVKGQDPLVDGAVDAMEASFAEQVASGEMELSPFNYYVSTATADEVVEFYDTEMPGYGWLTGQTQEQEFGKVQVFLGSDFETVALIGVLDMASVPGADAANLSGLIIFTGTGRETTGGGTDPGTGGGTDPGTGGTGGLVPATLDIAAPPGGTEVVPGEDAIMDVMVSTMTESFTDSSGTGGTFTTPVFYKTDTSLEELLAFYKEELAPMGYTLLPGNDAVVAGTATLVFMDSTSMNSVMVIMFEGDMMSMSHNLVSVGEAHY